MYLKADRQARIARAVNEFLNEDLLSSPQPRRLGIDASMRDVLAAASERIEGRFADEPEVEAAVRRTIGESYRNLGEFAAAVMHLSRAVELFEAQLGLETVTLESMNSLASLYYAMGKYDDSERLTRRVLHVAVPDPGLEDPISLVASQNLGLLEYRRGNLPEAIRILEACVETAERTDGPESDRTIGFLQNLAVAYSRNGDNEQLAELSKQMWTICERRHGPRHPDTINNAANYATALVELDRPAEAEPILETALDASRAVFGPSNVDTLYTMNALARVKDELGRVEEALSLYRETLDLRRKTLGTNHTSTVSSLINLTKLLTKQNRLDEALPLALEAKLVNAEINAAPDLKTVLIDTMLGDIYDKQADRQRAKTAYEAAIASARALGGNQVYLGRALARYGGLLHRDRPLEAEPSLREAQRIFERELGPDHENTREVVLKLSDIQAAGH
jgi:tetratricopeptide (TPR) repeat protein